MIAYIDLLKCIAIGLVHIVKGYILQTFFHSGGGSD